MRPAVARLTANRAIRLPARFACRAERDGPARDAVARNGDRVIPRRTLRVSLRDGRRVDTGDSHSMRCNGTESARRPTGTAEHELLRRVATSPDPALKEELQPDQTSHVPEVARSAGSINALRFGCCAVDWW